MHTSLRAVTVLKTNCSDTQQNAFRLTIAGSAAASPSCNSHHTKKAPFRINRNDAFLGASYNSLRPQACAAGGKFIIHTIRPVLQSVITAVAHRTIGKFKPLHSFSEPSKFSALPYVIQAFPIDIAEAFRRDFPLFLV